MEHATRHILHVNVTAHPTAPWTMQQLREAISVDHTYRFLLHDRDSIFSQPLDQHLRHLGLRVLKTPPQSPQAKPYCERVIGSIRRECLTEIIVLNEAHLRRVLRSYVDYYHTWRVQRSLAMDAPVPRLVHPPELDDVRKLPEVGGLHHHYERMAA